MSRNHPVARSLLKLLEQPSLATTFQGVYFILYIYFAATCFGPCWPLQAEYKIILCIPLKVGQQGRKHV
jgi:hypothetical protein